MRKSIAASLVIIMLVSFAFLSLTECMSMDKRSGGTSGGTLDVAADFKLRDINNIEVSLNDYKGKQPVFLFFWTTWCPYCVAELSGLNSKYLGLKENGCDLLAINVGESADKVSRYVKKYNPFFKVLLDKDKSVSSSFDILGVPTYVLLNKEGKIVLQAHSFPTDYKSLVVE